MYKVYATSYKINDFFLGLKQIVLSDRVNSKSWSFFTSVGKQQVNLNNEISQGWPRSYSNNSRPPPSASKSN